MRGDGSVYLRGDVWWMRFYRNGKPYSESAQTTVKTEARAKLRARVQESRTDKFVPPQIDRITISDLVQEQGRVGSDFWPVDGIGTLQQHCCDGLSIAEPHHQFTQQRCLPKVLPAQLIRAPEIGRAHV